MDLKSAVTAGNKDSVSFWLKKGADVNAPDENCRTPLSWAAQYGDEAIVQLFLETPDVAPNFRDDLGRIPLSWAAQHGPEAVVQLFLESPDVIPDCLDNLGRSPLSWASHYGRGTVVKQILARLEKDERMPQCDSPDKFGRTPLSLTAEDDIKYSIHDHDDIWRFYCKDAWAPGQQPRKIERVTVARLLLEARANLETTDTDGRTPLDWAILTKQEGLIDFYLQRLVNLHIQEGVDSNNRGDAARLLFLAIEHGYSEGVRELLSNVSDIDPNAKKDANTALCLAVQKCHEAAVTALLLHPKTDPNVKDDSGQTPLSIASAYGHHLLVRQLLQQEKINLNTRDDRGQTPLMLAIDSKHESVVRELLQHPEIDCLSQDNKGRRPIWAAVRTGCVEITKLLFGKTNTSLDFRDQLG